MLYACCDFLHVHGHLSAAAQSMHIDHTTTKASTAIYVAVEAIQRGIIKTTMTINNIILCTINNMFMFIAKL